MTTEEYHMSKSWLRLTRLLNHLDDAVCREANRATPDWQRMCRLQDLRERVEGRLRKRRRLSSILV